MLNGFEFRDVIVSGEAIRCLHAVTDNGPLLIVIDNVDYILNEVFEEGLIEGLPLPASYIPLYSESENMCNWINPGLVALIQNYAYEQGEELQLITRIYSLNNTLIETNVTACFTEGGTREGMLTLADNNETQILVGQHPREDSAKLKCDKQSWYGSYDNYDELVYGSFDSANPQYVANAWWLVYLGVPESILHIPDEQ